MANDTLGEPVNNTRVWILAIVLVVGAGVGFLIGRGVPSPQPVPQPTPVPTLEAKPTPTPVPTSYCSPSITPPVSAQNWKLFVKPDSNGNPCRVVDSNGLPVPIAVISKSLGHTIDFVADGKLQIIIHVPGNISQPFRNVIFNGPESQGTRWLLYCDGSGPCSTGPALTNQSYSCYYKYDQILNDKFCDAGIIIQP